MKWMKKKKCANCEKEHGCSECKKYQDKAFELEVDEELQQEKLAEWWKKYRFLVYGGVALILLATAGFEWYKNYQMKLRLSESDAFEEAVVMAYSGKNEEALTAFDKLGKSGKTGYRILALMNLADLQMNAGKKDEAIGTLKKILDTTSTKDPLHLISLLSYVTYQMDTENPDKLLADLEPALKNDAFQGLATELAALLLKGQGKKTEANQLIQKALQNPATSVNSKARLNTLMGE